MSEENNQQQNQKQPKSPSDVRTSIEKKIRTAEQKSFEAELEKKVKELNAAKKVFESKEQEVQDFMEENAHLF